MALLTDLIVNFGDIIELDYNIPHNEIYQLVDKHYGWKPYNPRKLANRRFGLSVTSIDGEYSGVPDLDSLKEFNYKNNTTYTESDFKTRTPIANEHSSIKNLLDDWGDELGRSHFLKLHPGGYFPPHRDNGMSSLVNYFRILIPISGFGPHEMKWVQEDKVLNFNVGTAYFVNTTKVHCLFSFVSHCTMLVLNIKVNDTSIEKLISKIKIR
jgi:hypothetical protein